MRRIGGAFFEVLTPRLPRVWGASCEHNLVVSWHVNRSFSRGYHDYAHDRMTKRWESPELQSHARDLVLNTIVRTDHPSSTPPVTPPQLAPTKLVHPATDFARVRHWKPHKHCAVDKVFATSPEELLQMRLAVAIARNPRPDLLKIAYTAARGVASDFAHLSPSARSCVFSVGAQPHESRSQDVLKNPEEIYRILSHPESVSPQKFLRVFEVFFSPFGVIANAYGSQAQYGQENRRIEDAKAARKKDGHGFADIEELDGFMKKHMMDSCLQSFVPYIKMQGSPMENLKWKLYQEGEAVPQDALPTLLQYIENCDGTGKCPKLPHGIITDKTRMSLTVHGHMHVPHFFNTSGTTGSLMQGLAGVLRKHGVLVLLDGPTTTTDFAMLSVGCTYQKQGFHSFHEVGSALRWTNKHLWQADYADLTGEQLVRSVRDTLQRTVDPKAKVAPVVHNAVEVITDSYLLLGELGKQHDVDLLAKAKLASGPTPPTAPTPTI